MFLSSNYLPPAWTIRLPRVIIAIKFLKMMIKPGQLRLPWLIPQLCIVLLPENHNFNYLNQYKNLATSSYGIFLCFSETFHSGFEFDLHVCVMKMKTRPTNYTLWLPTWMLQPSRDSKQKMLKLPPARHCINF